MQKGLVLVAALLLSGCASDPPSDDVAGAGGTINQGAAPFQTQPTPLRFASGDFEGLLANEASFGPTDICFAECMGNADQTFDLTSIVPANAPVELSIVIDGNAMGQLEFVDATPVLYESEFQGQGSQISAVVTRAESGSVILHLYSTGTFSFPPGQASAVTFEARSVVRADRLVAFVPAAIKMNPGETLNLTGDDVEEAILIAPDGAITRDATAPFTLTANGTAGLYTVLMTGDDSTPVYGPNVTMAAKRLVRIEGEVHPLTSGSATTWSFTPQGRPLIVGVTVASTPSPGLEFFSAGNLMTGPFQVSVTNPGNAVVVESSVDCTPMCSFPLANFRWDVAGDYLDERLLPGAYQVSVTYTGNGMQAFAWHLEIL